MRRFNAWLASGITKGVATMWCAYAFAALALSSLPNAIHAGRAALVAWIAQTFLQLVLLSIIMVGQSAHADALHTRHDASEARHDETHARLEHLAALVEGLAHGNE